MSKNGDKSDSKWFWGFIVFVVIALLAVGGFFGAVIHATFFEEELIPKAPEEKFKFYRSVLSDRGYEEITIHKVLRLSDNYVQVSFQEFLWIMDAGNYTKYFYSPQKEQSLTEWTFLPQAFKLWLYIDGTHWVVRTK